MPTASRRRAVPESPSGPDLPDPSPLNIVRLRGRLAAEPSAIELPSGDHAVVFRLVVPRPPERRRDGGRGARVDALECTVYAAALRRKVSRLAPGDIVEASGTLQRRFSRTGGAPVSRYSVVATEVLRVARAADVDRATMAW